MAPCETPGSPQSLFRLVANPIPTPLARLFQTPFRRSRTSTVLFRPLHPLVAISNHRLVSFLDDQFPYAGATALITIKKNCCPYPSMSSCAASSCMSFPKALSAFATLASSPTGAAPLSCRFALNYSEQYSHRRPNQKLSLLRNRARAHSGSVPSVAERW